MSYIESVRWMMGIALVSSRSNGSGYLLALATIFPLAVLSQTPAPQAVQQLPALQNPIPAGDLAFLSGYAGRTTKELTKDKQFRALKKAMIPRTEYHYGRDMPLTDALDEALNGSPLPVNMRDNRYVTVMGMQGPYLRGRGFLWFDVQTGIALGGFYFTPTNGEPTPTLTVFSRQLNQTALTLSELPEAFIEDLNQWSAVAGVPAITPRYFIPDNGKKYVLEHDEDYCSHPAGTPAPPERDCMQANLDAVNADMDAAYFMKETYNAANATAWMLDPQQAAWLAMRDSTCAGPNGLGCRIRMTRERTRIILGPRLPRPHPAQASR
ncbi:DUF1311 domain-containing protein [Telmatobacter sp. DSM 110680]|uniref:DUF1311 domain-containing protein n=1 Tax=Telmatobacter sp. DSM 110680 TaxID=3036704 RepID=A0AAU7DM33_9BACT